jgi:microcystin-dependent protein
MPTTYKGLTVPLSSDLADGPQAFRDYTDSLPASEAFIEGMLPVGSIVATCRTTAPARWLLLNGVTVTGAQTTYPKLWAVVPASWQSGADLILPNAKGRTIIMLDPGDTAIDTPGELLGAKTVVIAATNLPPHAHAQQGNTGGASARHRHGTTGGGQFVETAFAAGLQLPAGSGAVGANLTNTDTPDHTHTLSGNTGNGPGTSAPLNVMQPSIVMNYMIKAE